MPENSRIAFDHVAGDKIQKLIDTNFKFYKQINDDKDFRGVLPGLAVRAIQRTGQGGGMNSLSHRLVDEFASAKRRTRH
jgi:hypothetical protein